MNVECFIFSSSLKRPITIDRCHSHSTYFFHANLSDMTELNWMCANRVTVYSERQSCYHLYYTTGVIRGSNSTSLNPRLFFHYPLWICNDIIRGSPLSPVNPRLVSIVHCEFPVKGMILVDEFKFQYRFYAHDNRLYKRSSHWIQTTATSAETSTSFNAVDNNFISCCRQQVCAQQRSGRRHLANS